MMGPMRIGLIVLLTVLSACASGKPRPPPKDVPLDETRTFGPSRVIYWH
jgi:hypothetical protein